MLEGTWHWNSRDRACPCLTPCSAVIGAGPIVIGQACEFDYSGTQACKSLKYEGARGWAPRYAVRDLEAFLAFLPPKLTALSPRSAATKSPP